jgi:acetyltransferase-like isoleucine patch superfamily enzyme
VLDRLGERIKQLPHRIIPAVSILVAAVIESVSYNYYYRIMGYYYEYKIRRTAKEVGSGLYVRGRSRVNSETVLGENVHFHGVNIPYEGSVTIGDHFHAGKGCKIITENHDYDDGDALPYDDTVIRKPVDINDNVWFGVDVLVLPGVSIGEGAIIQAGSTVVSDIPKGAIAGGNPAAVFDQRDMDHYEKLKTEGKFH